MPESYNAHEKRYEQMPYRRVNNSGVLMPSVSLGLWHNFGHKDSFENMRQICRTAFDQGVNYFDLANNYGPPEGSAEENFKRILDKDLRVYRDELFIATKAGYYMWPGPFGEWGSRKYLLSSLDASLKRMGLDYVDLFYSHRYDPQTPLEETMGALAHAVHSGKALYAGISNYGPQELTEAVKILKSLGVPCLVNQIKYSMLRNSSETESLIATAENLGVSLVIYSPLAQGLLTDRYLTSIPDDSRAKKSHFLKPSSITPELTIKLNKLNQFAKKRGQNLSHLALAWVLRHPIIATALIGASKPEQVQDCIKATDHLTITAHELQEINKILSESE